MKPSGSDIKKPIPFLSAFIWNVTYAIFKANVLKIVLKNAELNLNYQGILKQKVDKTQEIDTNCTEILQYQRQTMTDITSRIIKATS